MSLRDMTWIERARKTEEFHKDKVKQNSNWSLADTANSLHRAKGAISEDLTLATFLSTHPEIVKYSYIKDAIEFCRKKKYMLRVR